MSKLSRPEIPDGLNRPCRVSPPNNRACGKPAIGKTTRDWKVRCCAEHFASARSNGFMPARYFADGTLAEPESPR